MTLRIIYLIILTIEMITGATLINCPTNTTVQYEKLIGLQPPGNYPKLLLYQQPQQQQQHNQSIILKCFEECNKLVDCQSFLVSYNLSTCYWYKTEIIENYQELQQYYTYNTDIVWFKKICLHNNNQRNCTKLWRFERIPGATLIGNNTKSIQQLLTRSQCQQACLDERQFECRSIKFRINYNSNNNTTTNSEINGKCILSDTDRFLSPNSFRISTYDEEYFENQCTTSINNNNNNNNNQFCAYDEYDNTTVLQRDFIYLNITKDACQQLCDNTTQFNCRGFSYKTNECYLHSIDSKVIGPKLLKLQQFSKYYERSNCLNLSIICTETEMIINYLPTISFNGQFYMDGFIDDPTCSKIGDGFNILTLKLSFVQLNRCGLIKANSLKNRTLIVGKLILQYNRYLQTQNDRLIRVGCIFQNNNSKIIVGNGITITTNPTTIHSSHLFNQTLNQSMIVMMRLIDSKTKQELSHTEIGQDLQLIIELTPKSLYDFRAYDLIAMTETGTEAIYLLDDNGCPTNPNIFPELTKQITNDSQQLIGRFQAFKFTTSAIVRFSVIVEFCKTLCPEYNCNQQQQRKRNKRQLPMITNIDRNQFENTISEHKQIPLELVMIVRNSSGAIADRLVLGDGRILVVGYDYINNQVCLDYSLVIGLIVTWILVQIICFICAIMVIRHYRNLYETELTRACLHKDFDLGYTNRHVHWADDNVGFT